MDAISPITLNLGLLLLSGLIFGYIASRYNLPRVAAYVIAGIIFSPGLLGRLEWIEVGGWAAPLTTTALGVIAYLIGGSITLKQLRRSGRVIFSAAIGESLGAVLCVFAAFWLLLPDTYALSPVQLALVFAAIAATTAPAGTIAILHQYRARGPVSNTLLGVVALDDAIGIILFSLMMVVVVGESLTMSLGTALLQIGGAIVLGVLIGRILCQVGKRFHQGGLLLPLVLGHILLALGLAEILNLSPLLATMALGFSSRYFSRAAGDRMFIQVEYFEELVFLIFFTLAGAHFEFTVFVGHLDLVLIYFVARIIGKIGGAALGAAAVGASQPVVRWLGLGLVPQAGVAVGLALTLGNEPVFKELSTMILNVILATTLLYEVLGPLAAKFALGRANELGRERGKEE
ncbi:MAG: cation:proton antiporter [Proteobacteria bacterium]|nr:cation:proton antiporter [Pseudomonadota bacterium]MBU1057414.1 cation:proton antiporter [Pseudomonadota bacterium]